MDMTGTFMPAYGLNRIFGELPLVGMILGNGRDRGLIGVTFKLSGDAKTPDAADQPAVGDRARHIPVDLRVPLSACGRAAVRAVRRAGPARASSCRATA